jgi:alginate O-acetyltransferase complex protein AlgI
MVAFVSSHSLDGHRTIRRVVRKMPAIVYWPTVVVIWLFAIAVSQDSSSKFIYFDF